MLMLSVTVVVVVVRKVQIIMMMVVVVAMTVLEVTTVVVVFLSCPLVKKHADLSGSFLYSQSTMKDMYSKPTNRTDLSNPMKTKKALRSHSIYIYEPKNVRETKQPECS